MDEPTPADLATTDEWFGRPTAQEFLLELLWTNFIRVTEGTLEMVEQLAADCSRVMEKGWTPAEGFDPDRGYAVHQHAINHVENLWQKVQCGWRKNDLRPASTDEVTLRLLRRWNERVLIAHAAISSAATLRGAQGSTLSRTAICSFVRSAILSCRQPVRRKMWTASERAIGRVPPSSWLAYGTLIPTVLASTVGVGGFSMAVSLHNANLFTRA